MAHLRTCDVTGRRAIGNLRKGKDEKREIGNCFIVRNTKGKI
jgi:hypothetical protein